MRAVNLLPAGAYAPKQRLPYAPVVLAATAPVLAGALVYLGYSVEHSKVADRNIVLAAAQSEVAALGPSAAAVAEAGQVADERTNRLAEVSDALAKQVGWDVAFEQIARVLPTNSWITALDAQAPVPVAGATTSTTTFTLQGYTLTQADVAQVLARLSLVPSLTNVTLGSSTETVLGNSKNVVQFAITGTIVQVPQ